MPAENHRHGYVVTLRYLPGSGFTVAIATDSGEHQEAPAPLLTLGSAFSRAQKVLADAGFTVEIAK